MGVPGRGRSVDSDSACISLACWLFWGRFNFWGFWSSLDLWSYWGLFFRRVFWGGDYYSSHDRSYVGRGRLFGRRKFYGGFNLLSCSSV